jgi:hypothetical protein
MTTVTPKQLAQVNIPLGKNIYTSGQVSGSVVVNLTATTALLVYGSGSYGACQVMTVNADGSITYGGVYSFNSNSATQLSAIALDSTHVMIAFQDGANSYYGTVIVATVSGNSISFESKYVFLSTIATYISITKVTASTAFIGCYDGTNGRGIMLSWNGSYVVNMGTPMNFLTTNVSYLNCTTLDATHVFISYLMVATNVFGIVGVVSGTTISSFGTPVGVPVTGSNYNSCVALSNTSVLLVWSTASGISDCIVTISGTTITYGTPFSLSILTGATLVGVSFISSTSVAIAFLDANYVQLIIANISGSNITLGNKFQVYNASVYSVQSSITMFSTSLCIYNYSTITGLALSYSSVLTVNGLAISASGVVSSAIVTGTSDHTEITSIYIVNTGTSAAIVTLLVGGSGGLNNNVIRKISIAAEADCFINLANCPIILTPGQTLRAYQNSFGQIPITCFGLELT